MISRPSSRKHSTPWIGAGDSRLRGVTVLFLTTVVSVAVLFVSAAAAAQTAPSQAPALKVLFVAVITQMLFVGCCAVLVMFHVSRSTRAILSVLRPGRSY